MESKTHNPILNFRLADCRDINEELNADYKENTREPKNYAAGSFITLTREAIDSTESAS